MTKALQDFSNSDYDRPNLRWSCGKEELENGCPRGPHLDGRCVTHAMCEPLEQGDLWKCGRSSLQGGACDPGPHADGQCGFPVGPCNPVRSLRSRRGRFVMGSFCAAVGLLAVCLSGSYRQSFFAPGPLTENHALILKSTDSDRCATCHSDANQNLASWLWTAVCGRNANHVPQSKKCLACHANRIHPTESLLAHTMEAAQLARITKHAQERLAKENDKTNRSPTAVRQLSALECSLCHREHHGSQFDLKLVSDQQCQACHQEQFHSFSRDHPEFTQWPAQRRPRIAFDHGAHERRHFPEAKRKFQCIECHVSDDSREPARNGSFESNCASCHDKEIQTAFSEPIPFLQLPILDRRVFEQKELSIGQWPEQLTGDFDGALPPIMVLMLWADPATRPALDQFSGTFDFFDVNLSNFDELEAAHDIVWGIKRLLLELKQDGELAVRRRAARVIALGQSQQSKPDSLDALTIGFDPSKLQPLLARFDALERELQRTPQPIRDATPDRRNASAVWNGSADGSEISVSLSGHANPFLKAWLDLAGYLGDSALERLPQLVGPSGTGQCTMCHSLEFAGPDSGVVKINWRSHLNSNAADSTAPTSAAFTRDTFTRFRHAPHLTQSELYNCVGCHRVDLTADYSAAFQSLDPQVSCNGFEAMEKKDCASCHVPNGAGDNCLKCHPYHTGTGDLNFSPLSQNR